MEIGINLVGKLILNNFPNKQIIFGAQEFLKNQPLFWLLWCLGEAEDTYFMNFNIIIY